MTGTSMKFQKIPLEQGVIMMVDIMQCAVLEAKGTYFLWWNGTAVGKIDTATAIRIMSDQDRFQERR